MGYCGRKKKADCGYPKALLAYKVYKDLKAFKVLRGSKVLKDRRVYKEYKGYRAKHLK